MKKLKDILLSSIVGAVIFIFSIPAFHSSLASGMQNEGVTVMAQASHLDEQRIEDMIKDIKKLVSSSKGTTFDVTNVAGTYLRGFSKEAILNALENKDFEILPIDRKRAGLLRSDDVYVAELSFSRNFLSRLLGFNDQLRILLGFSNGELEVVEARVFYKSL